MSAHTFDFDVVEIDDLVRNDDLLAKAKSLTLPNYCSGMNVLLRYWEEHRDRHIDAKAIFLMERNTWISWFGKVEKKIVGWCLITHEDDQRSFHPRDGHVGFQVFVNPDYRGKGYGTALLNKAKEVFAGYTLDVYGEDRLKREKFFGKHMRAGYVKDLTSGEF